MENSFVIQTLDNGKASLGLEVGSTRIKACLVGENPASVIAIGSAEWENSLVDGLWTYPLDSVWEGIATAMADLAGQVSGTYGTGITTLRSIGISGMMHGYLAFDEDGKLLVPFRTWRNTNTQKAAEELTELFGVNIPLRWSVAHLHQAVRDEETHVSQIRFVTTIAGYIHWKLSGEKVLGINDASGMFPINPASNNYDVEKLDAYEKLVQNSVLPAPLRDLLPKVLAAGNAAGLLTADGARLLDPGGNLVPGTMLCPPEGDAGTGMVATKAVTPKTGNVSAGTSIFAMVVLDRPLQGIHHEIDLVTTPVGDPVAMVHCNNGTSELAAWVGMFRRFSRISGLNHDSDEVYDALLQEALDADADAGGLVAYNYLAGEPITAVLDGRPLFLRTPDSNFTLGNAIRSQLYGVFATLSLGMEVLKLQGHELDQMSAHGGLFKTQDVAQRFLASALGVPVSVTGSAPEGGAWGAAILAAFAASQEDGLATYLEKTVFDGVTHQTVEPNARDVEGFSRYLERFKAGLQSELLASRVV